MEQLIDGMLEKDYIRCCMFEYELDHKNFDFSEFLQMFPRLRGINNLLAKMRIINNSYNDSKIPISNILNLINP